MKLLKRPLWFAVEQRTDWRTRDMKILPMGGATYAGVAVVARRIRAHRQAVEDDIDELT